MLKRYTITCLNATIIFINNLRSNAGFRSKQAGNLSIHTYGGLLLKFKKSASFLYMVLMYIHPMKKCIFLLLSISCFGCSFAQSVKKYSIGNSGCSVYSFCDPGTFNESYSEDSARVYTSECVHEETNYGLICIKLTAPVTDLEVAEKIVVSYLDYLKTAFKISSSVGYGKGHRLKEREDTRGVTDYWTDEEKNNWKIKGWTNGTYIAVLFAYTKKELPETKVNVFLDGLLFEGMTR